MSTEKNPLYGLWDVTASCWLGHAGEPLPLLYSDSVIQGEFLSGEKQARFAATMMTRRFKEKSQIHARVYDGTALRIREIVTPPLSVDQVFARLHKPR